MTSPLQVALAKPMAQSLERLVDIGEGKRERCVKACVFACRQNRSVRAFNKILTHMHECRRYQIFIQLSLYICIKTKAARKVPS